MIVSFCGSVFGLKTAQHVSLAGLLKRLAPRELHHTCSRGADEEAHHLARHLLPGIVRVAHPGTCSVERAYLHDADVTHLPVDRAERTRQIATVAEVVIVCPWEAIEQNIGSAWALWREARRQGKETYLIRPDGQTEHVAARRVQGELFEGSAR